MNPARTVEAASTSAGKGLNVRQMEVLKLVAEGLSYKEVGARLGLSSSAIRYHMAEIMYKLHLENRTQVLGYAGRLGLGGERAPE